MKNLHLSPTNKETRLYLSNYGKELNLASHPKTLYSTGQNIYITSDEEIKEGDWVYCLREGFEPILKQKVNAIGVNSDNMMKKIILTTDQSLDGVQSIDDEFLEWFVKNPSCEEVFIQKEYKQINQDNPITIGSTTLFFSHYKIVLLREDIKQENCCTPIGQIKRYVDCKGCDRKPTQEILEEVAENYAEQYKYIGGKISFKRGAKWQQERSYSEEDMKSAWDACKKFKRPISEGNALNFNEFIEQFKKK